MIKFSIIVAIYNVGNYLRQCIDSVLNQSYPNFELILVNDGSVDNSAEICDEYAGRDRRITVIHKENAGASAARNEGVEKARGEYLMYLDGDDFWDTEYLSNVVSLIDETSYDVYFSNSRYDYYSEEQFEKVILYDTQSLRSCSKIELLDFFINSHNQIPAATWHNIYKTSFVRKNNLYFNEKLSWSEDTDLFFNTLTHLDTAGFFDYTFYYYRKSNAGAMTKKISLQNISSQLYVLNKWYVFFAQSDYSSQIQQQAKERFANTFIYMIKFIIHTDQESRARVIQEFKNNSFMDRSASGINYKFIKLCSRVFGYYYTSKLINMVTNRSVRI